MSDLIGAASINNVESKEKLKVGYPLS